MSGSRHTLPVIELFRGTTRLELLEGVLTELEDGEWYRTGELLDHLSVSRESFRTHMKPMVNFGVFEIRDPDVNIPHYRVADTEVVRLLREYHESDYMPLTKLLGNTPSRVLVEFFLTQADPERGYSRTKLQEITDAGYQGIKNNIGTLVEAGVLTELEGKRGTKYQVVMDSPVVRFLQELNEALYTYYQSQSEDE